MSAKPTEDMRDAAYERGWVDSLHGVFAACVQLASDKYDYISGWHACAKYRWRDPKGRGVAPDTSYREPRQ